MTYALSLLLLFCAISVCLALYTILPRRLFRNRHAFVAPMPFVQKQKPDTKAENVANELAFEKFVVERFSRKHFPLIEPSNK